MFCFPQGAFSGIFVGFVVSLWLAVGSTLYPPSEETMGVLPSYASICSPSNISLNITPSQDHHTIPPSTLPQNINHGWWFYKIRTDTQIKHFPHFLCWNTSYSGGMAAYWGTVASAQEGVGSIPDPEPFCMEFACSLFCLWGFSPKEPMSSS